MFHGTVECIVSYGKLEAGKTYEFTVISHDRGKRISVGNKEIDYYQLTEEEYEEHFYGAVECKTSHGKFEAGTTYKFKVTYHDEKKQITVGNEKIGFYQLSEEEFKEHFQVVVKQPSEVTK